MKDLRN